MSNQFLLAKDRIGARPRCTFSFKGIRKIQIHFWSLQSFLNSSSAPFLGFGLCFRPGLFLSEMMRLLSLPPIFLLQDRETEGLSVPCFFSLFKVINLIISPKYFHHSSGSSLFIIA
jgi:hypothetical protein